jgi:hypothetical protein
MKDVEDLVGRDGEDHADGEAHRGSDSGIGIRQTSLR